MKFIRNHYLLNKYITGVSISYVAWYSLNALYLFIRHDALSQYSELLNYESIHYELNFALFANGFISIFLSIFSWNFYYFLDRRGRMGTTKRIIIAILLVSIVTPSFLFLTRMAGTMVFPDGIPYFNNFTEGGFLVYIFYVLMSTVLINSLFQLKDILGPELFSTVIQGNYYVPKEEERIFMFLDLNNSTTIAECLGHLNYSHFISDCYTTMTDAIDQNKASVYQYVGDEIVLTWPIKKGIKKNRCIQILFDIQNSFEERREYFTKQFGSFPEFKAGVHSGKVAATQIGVIKREMAYHGDVVNSTARLQEMCKELGVNYLISKDLADQLDYQFIELGEVQPRGKYQKIKVFGLENPSVYAPVLQKMV
ncbi:adenylate/guanylate cyclase domain-containing protein [Flammeovirga sp. MY04]|uniref:adenylate/guanylate cyclase domain-containing protein n=1 Tax=Flammeovirga sp. MY04 TaxID=1191459 RepID=UPI0008262982|nr:adenylate/guanylate cyclase domain-containing protein [Flammeovirga sp. MY04]ANQ52824.2 adenylate/guanylate cyclase domain-containing protein [Flammeovirga sp. MY04]